MKGKSKKPPRLNERDKVAEAPERAEEAPEGDGGGRSGEKGSTMTPPHNRNGEFFPVVDGADADMSDESAACSPAQARALSGALPARLRNATWRLRYSTKRDGTSLRTMYRRAGAARVGEHRCEESVLLVRTSRGERFGAFTTEHWRVAPRYYGTGESFVFVLVPGGSEGAGERTLVRRSRDRIRRRAAAAAAAAARGCFRGRKGTTTSSLAGTSARRWVEARGSRCGWTRSWRGGTALGPTHSGTIR